jgi:drug/metabolite transporter (DMT)-like permease
VSDKISERLANISGMTAIAIWFATPLMLALTGTMPPFEIGAFAYLVAFALTVGWWIYKGEKIVPKFNMPLRAYALGIFGICLYNMLYIYAIKNGPILEVNLLNYLWPAFLLIFGSLLEKTRPDNLAIVGIIFCFVGSYFVFASHGTLAFSGDHTMMLLGFLCGIIWAGYSSLLRYVRIKSDQTAVFFLIAGLVMLAMHFVFEPAIWPATTFGWLMLTAYALSRVAFYLWNFAMKHGTTRLMGSLSYFIPLFATITLTAAGFGNYDPILFIGAALIISGCIVINLKSLAVSASAFIRKAFA